MGRLEISRERRMVKFLKYDMLAISRQRAFLEVSMCNVRYEQNVRCPCLIPEPVQHKSCCRWNGT